MARVPAITPRAPAGRLAESKPRSGLALVTLSNRVSTFRNRSSWRDCSAILVAEPPSARGNDGGGQASAYRSRTLRVVRVPCFGDVRRPRGPAGMAGVVPSL
jgi:hypothetical protein